MITTGAPTASRHFSPLPFALMTTPTPDQVRAIVLPLLREGETLHHLPNPQASWPYVWEIRHGREFYGFSSTASLLSVFE
jgi:hypothetical protein